MAKKRRRRKAKQFRFGRLVLPETVIALAVAAASSPLGRQIMSDALVHAAGVFLRKYPGPAAASAGAEAASAAKDFAHAASEAAANFMHAAAERIRNHGEADNRAARGDAGAKRRAAGRSGNGAEDFGNSLDEETIRRALMGEFRRKKAKKKRAKSVSQEP